MFICIDRHLKGKVIKIEKEAFRNISHKSVGTTNANDVRKFLTGLELHGLGKLIQNCNDKPVFKLADKENLTEQKTINLFKNLNSVNERDLHRLNSQVIFEWLFRKRLLRGL